MAKSSSLTKNNEQWLKVVKKTVKVGRKWPKNARIACIQQNSGQKVAKKTKINPT